MTLHDTILTIVDNESLCFLWLILGINFLDYVRALSFALCLGTLHGSMVNP